MRQLVSSPPGHTAGQWRSCTLSFLCGTCPSSDFSSPKTRPGISLLPPGDAAADRTVAAVFCFVPESSNRGSVYLLTCFSDSLTCLEVRTKSHQAWNPKQSPQKISKQIHQGREAGDGAGGGGLHRFPVHRAGLHHPRSQRPTSHISSKFGAT